MRLPILGGSADGKYKINNSQRTVNWCPIVTGATEDNKTELYLSPTPGYSLFSTLTGTSIRAFFTARTHGFTRCFAVIDKTLYEIATSGTPTSRGTLTDIEAGSNRLYMGVNPANEVFIGGVSASYVFDMDTDTLTKITDVEFPNSVSSMVYTDTYGIISSNGSVFISDSGSFLNWSAINTYSPTFTSAPVVALGSLKEQIFNFTTESIEVYVATGDDPIYERLPRTSIKMGIRAKNSLACAEYGFIFLGQSNNGGAAVYYYDGWNPPVPISDTNFTWQINQSTSLDAAYGYIQHNKEGQKLYYLTIPDLNRTFCYNLNSKKWFDKSSLNPTDYAGAIINPDQFRGAFYTYFNDYHLFADTYTGKIFKEDYSIFTEDSLPIYRKRDSQIISNEDKYLSVEELIIDCSVGTANGASTTPDLQISWSVDGGNTFTTPVNLLLGLIGEFTYQAKLTNLGMGRRWVFRIECSDPIDIMIQDAYINATSSEF